MENEINELYARAQRVRTPMYRVCKGAGVHPGTLSGWRKGVDPKLSTITKIRAELDRLEAEKASAAPSVWPMPGHRTQEELK